MPTKLITKMLLRWNGHNCWQFYEIHSCVYNLNVNKIKAIKIIDGEQEQERDRKKKRKMQAKRQTMQWLMMLIYEISFISSEFNGILALLFWPHKNSASKMSQWIYVVRCIYLISVCIIFFHRSFDLNVMRTAPWIICHR